MKYYKETISSSTSFILKKKKNNWVTLIKQNFWWKHGEALSRTNTQWRVLTQRFAKFHALSHSFHDLGDKDLLVGIATVRPDLRLLIQQYFDIVDYFGSLYDQ
jgi:hypothetical protein